MSTGGEEKTTVKVSLKRVLLASLAVALLILLAAFLLESQKPRLNLKAEYLPNGTVVISGKLTYGLSPVPGKWVAIEVRRQDGVIVWIDAVKTLSDGSFKTSFTLNTAGSFEVYANTDIAKEKTSFTVTRG